MFSHRSFSFENLDGYNGLFILISGENLRFFGGDERSSRDDITHNSSNGFNSQRKGGGINDDNSLSILRFFSTDNSSLNSGSISYGFIGVDSLVGFFSIEEISD